MAEASLNDLDITEHGDEPKALVLIDPRDNTPATSHGKPWTVYVLASQSAAMQKFLDDQATKNAKRSATITPAIQRDRFFTNEAGLLMGKAWENIPDDVGGELAWTLTNAKMFLARLPWAHSQIKQYAIEAGNFYGFADDLADFGRWHFRLNAKPKGSALTTREWLESAVDDDPSALEALCEPEFDWPVRDAAFRLWGIYLDLRRRTPGDMAGPRAIPYSEIAARCALLRRPLEPWQVEALTTLDVAFLECAAERE